MAWEPTHRRGWVLRRLRVSRPRRRPHRRVHPKVIHRKMPWPPPQHVSLAEWWEHFWQTMEEDYFITTCASCRVFLSPIRRIIARWPDPSPGSCIVAEVNRLHGQWDSHYMADHIGVDPDEAWD